MEDDTICFGKNGEKYTLESMFKQVREVLGDSAAATSETELKEYMRSESFGEVFPDLFEAFNSMERRVLEQNTKANVAGSSKINQFIKQEKLDDDRKTVGVEPIIFKQKVKSEVLSDENGPKPNPRKNSFNHSDSFDSEDERRHQRKKVKRKKHHKKKSRSDSAHSSSSSEGPHSSKYAHSKKKDIKTEIKIEPKEKSSTKASESAPKVHPFYLGQMGEIIKPKGKLFEDQLNDNDYPKRKKKKLEEPPKKKHHHPPPPPPPTVREPKPFTYYNTSAAKPGKSWKPREELEFQRNQKKYKLATLSILCVDLIKLENIFHNPSKGKPLNSVAMPLKGHMIIPDRKAEEIQRYEKVKRLAYRPVLNKLYSRNRRNSLPSVSSDDRNKGKNRKRVVSSDASSSDPMIPSNRLRQGSKDEKSGLRRGTAEWKKEQRLKGLEQLREAADQKNRTTRKLPWENTDYFGKKKNDRPSSADKRDMNSKDKSKAELSRLAKIPKKHAPATPFHNILQQIQTANQEAANKPKVELRIPKFSETTYTFKKQQKTVNQGLVAQEVDKLLRSNTTVQCPAMTTTPSQLAEYTIRKIGWWFLKEEHDPPDDVLFHPELHDNEIYDDWYDPEEHRDDDDISIGCVSDPEGIATAADNLLPVAAPDPDKLDEYGGCATLEARIQKISPGEVNPEKITMKRFIAVKPGCNYEKNFEAKCYLCSAAIKGTRQLAAHIRSAQHKDEFRNYSLKAAKYEERTVKVPSKKIFVARLIQYSVEDSLPAPVIDVSNDPEPKDLNQEGEVCNEIEVEDSPRAVIDSNHGSTAPDVVRLEDLADDELSLPDLVLFDLEADNVQLRAKICLRTNGFWTDEMESRWQKMQEKETRMTEQYNQMREEYINAPDTHPAKGNEWVKFWDRRSSEVEAEGKNPDDHDFAGEWIPYWLKRVQEIMKADIERKMLKMKQEFGLDAETLTNRCRERGLNPDSVQINPQTHSSEIKVDQCVGGIPPSQNDLPQSQNTLLPSRSSQQVVHGNGQVRGAVPHQFDAQPNQFHLTSIASKFRNQPHVSGANMIPLGINAVTSQIYNPLLKPIPSAPPPPALSRQTQGSNPTSHYSKDRKDLRDSYRDNRRGKNRSRSRSPPLNRYHWNKDQAKNKRRKRRRSRSRQPDRRNSNEDNHAAAKPIPSRISSPDSDWETAPQKKLLTSSLNPNNKRNSYEDKPVRHFSKTSSPDSDWEMEAHKNYTNPTTDPTKNLIKSTIDRAPLAASCNPPIYTQFSAYTLPIPVKQKVPMVPNSVGRQNPDLETALAELEVAMVMAEPVLSSELPDSRHTMSILEPSVSNTNGNDINQYSPINSSVAMPDWHDPFGDVSPINTSVEMEVEEERIDSVSVHPPKKNESPKRKPKAATNINPSSPEDGELDSEASSISIDQNMSSFIWN